jgi:hypothetical protein
LLATAWIFIAPEEGNPRLARLQVLTETDEREQATLTNNLHNIAP